MKNQKSKIIAFILVFALLITAVVVTSVANAKTVDIQLESDKTELLAGESATISVKVTTNFSVATMSIPVFYDKTLVDVSEATATLTEYAVANTTTESQSVDTAKVYANTGISSDKFGFVLATYIAGANKEVAESIDEVVLTFKITAKTDVSGNATVKVVQESAKTDDNVAGMLYFGATTNGRTINSVPENIEKIDLTAAIKSVKIGELNNTPTLEVKPSDEFEYADYVVLDKVNTNYEEFTGIIYGIDTLDQNEMLEQLAGSLADVIKASTDDETHIIITPNDAGVESTGALIEIVDSDGNVLETYVFVYFGDVDGDAMISANDAYIAEYYEASYEGIASYAQYVASDVDGDGMPSANDAYIMEYYEVSYEGVDYQYNLGQNAMNNTYDWIY